MKPFTLQCILVLALAGCGAGPIADEEDTNIEAPKTDLPDESLGDRWHCGELGLVCVGPLGTGECIDGECTARLGNQCWGATFAPTCDDYCEEFELSCAHQACDGATVWGWTGEPEWADEMCGYAKKDTATPLGVPCDEPLEGLLTTFLCCCE
jgi:hypothetical protein